MSRAWFAAVLVFGAACKKQPFQVIVSEPFVRTAVFDRPGHFVAKNESLEVLDLTTPGEAKPVFKIFPRAWNNGEIATTTTSTSVVFAAERRLIRADMHGATRVIADLDAFDTPQLHDRLAGANLNWHLSSDSPSDRFYFVALRGEYEWPFIGQLRLSEHRLSIIDAWFPVGIDVDPDRGIVCAPLGVQRDIRVRNTALRSFDGRLQRDVPTSAIYYGCRFSPNRSRVLLSCTDLDDFQPIAILAIPDGREEILGVTGSGAAWLSEEEIAFNQGEGKLVRYDLVTKKTSVLADVLPKRSHSRSEGSYAREPVISPDRTWMAWNFGAEDRTGTVVFDLRSKKYRVLDGRWHNVQFVSAR